MNTEDHLTTIERHTLGSPKFIELEFGCFVTLTTSGFSFTVWSKWQAQDV